MRNSTVIASCLVNLKLVHSLGDGERLVRDIFQREFPEHIFSEWNVELNDKAAADLIRVGSKSSFIHVENLIQQLDTSGRL